MDGGQSGDQPTGQRNVVVADHRQVIGNAEAEPAGDAVGAHRRHVVDREDRCGPIPHRQQSLGAAGAAVLDIARLDDQLRVRFEARLGEGGQVAAPAKDAGADGGLPGEMRDAPVTQAVEVLGGDLRAHDVIRADERIEAVVAEAVDEHVRDPLLTQPANGWVAQKRAGQDDAVDPPRGQARQV